MAVPVAAHIARLDDLRRGLETLVAIGALPEPVAAGGARDVIVELADARGGGAQQLGRVARPDRRRPVRGRVDRVDLPVLGGGVGGRIEQALQRDAAVVDGEVEARGAAVVGDQLARLDRDAIAGRLAAAEAVVPGERPLQLLDVDQDDVDVAADLEHHAVVAVELADRNDRAARGGGDEVGACGRRRLRVLRVVEVRVVDRRDVGQDHAAVRVDVGELRGIDERRSQLAALAGAAASAHLVGEGAALRAAALAAALRLALRVALADLLEQRHRLRTGETTRLELDGIAAVVRRACEERLQLLLTELPGQAGPGAVHLPGACPARRRQGGSSTGQHQPECESEKRCPQCVTHGVALSVLRVGGV